MNIVFKNEDIINIIRSLNVNKVDRHDNFFIRILKVFHTSIMEPIPIVFISLWEDI